MGVFTHEMEVTSPIPPAKAFKVFALEFDTIFPKAVPNAVKSVELLEGNGGPGTIKKVTFAEGVGFDNVKYRVEELDQDNLSYAYSAIEGGELNDVIEKITYETKLGAAPNGGTSAKITIKVYTIGDIVIKEDHIKHSMEKRAKAFKAVEKYVLENPDA